MKEENAKENDHGLEGTVRYLKLSIIINSDTLFSLETVD
jgi:hypothetical protein